MKLLDFGTARVLGSTFTRGGALVGSAAYMAPEQLAGSDVDGRADVFAAGAILYELLAGRRAFDAEGIAAVMNKILHEAPAPLASIVPGAPADIVRALDTALQKDVALRYQEAAEFGTDLRLARYGLDADDVSSAVTVESPAPVAAPAALDQGTVVIPRAARVTSEPRLPEETPPRRSDGLGEAVPAAPAVAGTSVVSRRAALVPVSRNALAAFLPVSRNALAAFLPVSRNALAAFLVVGVTVALVMAWLMRPEPAGAPAFRLDVSSVPAGAAIEIDGAPTGRRTPATVSLTTRPRRLRLLLPGYETVDTAIAEAAMDAPDALAFTLRRLVRVDSMPSGARILIDSRDTGLLTPADVPVAPGSSPSLLVEAGDHSHAEVRLTDALLEKGVVNVVLEPSRRRAPDVRQAGGGSTPADRPGVSDGGGENADGQGLPGRSGTSLVGVHAAGSYPFALTGCSRGTAVRLNLAALSLRLRNQTEAVRELERVVKVLAEGKVPPSLADAIGGTAHYLMGIATEASGDLARAEAAWRQAAQSRSTLLIEGGSIPIKDAAEERLQQSTGGQRAGTAR